MISRVAIGYAEIPESEPAEPVVVVVPIVPSMLTDTYAVNWLLPAELPPEDVEITAQDSDTVTLTVTRPDGYAGTPGLIINLICTLDTDIDTGWVDAAAFLDAGWTGTVRLRKDGSIVYFQFELTPTATIDGTPKTDGVAVLNGMDSTWQVTTIWGPLWGWGGDEDLQPIAIIPSGSDSLIAGGAADVTGTWEDGVSILQGQVSWVADS